MRLLALAAGAFACASVSCAAILGFERLQVEEEASTADAAPEAFAVDAAEDAPSPCTELGVPPPPSDAGAGASPAILGALRVLDFGIDVDGGRPQVPGFNLDLVCSTDVGTSSCSTNVLPTAFETHAKDKSAEGIDNAGFSLLEYISRFSSVLHPQEINDGLTRGRYGLVMRVDAWNGQSDDDDVLVELFPAIGFERGADGGTAPTFDRQDVWRLDERFRVGGVLEASTLRSSRAWITAGRLVARFKEIVLPVLISDDPKLFDVRLSDGVMTATVDTTSDGIAMLRDGVLAGRWKTSDFLGQVRTIYLRDSNGLKDTTLCDDVLGARLLYAGVKDTICEARDIRADSMDNKGLPCDAVSAAARLEAYPIDTLGTFVPPPDASLRCAVAPAIPLGDDCP